ncbi:hypothetical protein pb186bvf_006722 [Paramecium bursaria]
MELRIEMENQKHRDQQSQALNGINQKFFHSFFEVNRIDAIKQSWCINQELINKINQFKIKVTISLQNPLQEPQRKLLQSLLFLQRNQQ